MNFKNIARIASITFEENYRKKFLYILFFLCAGIIIASWVFDPFEIGQQLPVVKDISLTGLSFFAIIMTFALFLSAIPAEIEKKTIYPIMSKPVNRSEYLWGKYMGNMFMVFINIYVLSFMILILLKRISGLWMWSVFNSSFLLFIECGIVGAIITLFSPWMSYPVNLVLTFFFYISGNVSSAYIHYLTTDPKTRFSASLLTILKLFIPNFEFLHIKNSVVHSYIVDPNYIAGAAAYGIVFILIIMLVADLLFKKKDL
ncbi:MAG: ABC transporter permease [Vulcanimicrobiota bacterium]